MTVERKYFEEKSDHPPNPLNALLIDFGDPLFAAEMVSPDRPPPHDRSDEKKHSPDNRRQPLGDGRRPHHGDRRSSPQQVSSSGRGGPHFRGDDPRRPHSPPVKDVEGSGEEKQSFADIVEREAHYRNSMVRDRRMEIVNMDEDGNCLFRAVSHQVYGDPEHHLTVREKCVDYLESQSDFFRNYVAEEENDFSDYCEHMKNSGIWGGEVEVQAMSEIYDRTIEIYVYQTSPARTYHEKGELGELDETERPIRLSYHFNSHYNSVRPFQNFDPIIPEMPPGQYEDEHIQQLNSQEIDRSLSHILEASRAEFEKNHAKDFDEQMKEAMKISIDDMVTKAVETESLMTTLEENELEAAKEKSKLDYEAQEQVAGTGDVEDCILEGVLQQSLTESLPGPVDFCHRQLSFDLEQCKMAYAYVISLNNGSQMSDDVIIELMSQYMMNPPVSESFDIYSQY